MGEEDERIDVGGPDLTPLLQCGDGGGVLVHVGGGGLPEPAATLPSPPLSPSAPGATHWLLCAAILLADMLGLGTLSLPGDFARLGWAPALACLVLFCLANLYAGVLYQRLATAVPRAPVFDAVGAAAMGGAGRTLVFCCVYVSILLQPVMLHLVCMEALVQTFVQWRISQAVACAAVAAVILPLGQVRHMEDIGWLSVAGTCSMVFAMGVVLAKLGSAYLAGARPTVPTELVARGRGLQSALVGAMDVAFAFGGQINWWRYIRTMRRDHLRRGRFASAVAMTGCLMGLIYLAVAAAGYAVLGAGMDVHKPVTSVLGRDAWAVAMNAALLVRCMIAYAVNLNVCCSLVIQVAAPGIAAGRGRCGAAAAWLLASLLCVSCAAALALALPFFSIVMAVVASLGDVMSMIGLPCLFAVKLLPMPRWEAGACRALVVVAVALSAAGIASSVQQLAEAHRGGGG